MRNTKFTRRLAGGMFAAAGISALVAWGFPVLEYAWADPIERIGIDTRRKLAEYERSGNAEPLRAWVMRQDAAFFTAAMSALGAWAMRHPQEFLAFLDAMDTKQVPEFAEGFGFILADLGMDDAFRKAFRGHRSRRLSAVLGAIPKLEPWPKP